MWTVPNLEYGGELRMKKLAMRLRDSALVTPLGDQVKTHWVLAILVLLLVGIIGLGSVGDAIYHSLQRVTGLNSLPGQFSELFSFGLSLLFLFLWVRFKEKRSFLSIGIADPAALKKFSLGWGVGFLMMLIPSAILLMHGDYQLQHAVNQANAVHRYGMVELTGLLLGIGLVSALQSGTEEMIMRGYLLQTAAQQLSPWAAILVPAILFAIVHLSFDPIVFSNILLFAVAVSLICLKQGSIWFAAGMHAGWNMTQGTILGIPVSGNSYTFSLLSLRPVADAPVWLTGGDFGVEASFPATIMLVLILCLSCRYFFQGR